MEWPCNYPNRCKINGKCPYNEKYWTSYIVYKVVCRETGSIYLGKTQWTLEERMNGHYSDVHELV